MSTVEDITLGGVRSRAVRVSGSADRPTFLFLHGYSDSVDSWRRVQRRLGELGYPSLAVDQPSHGGADRLDGSQPVIPQFVAFAAAAAEEAAGGEPVIVVGNSLGGAHALLLAQHHPEQVQGVVAISPAGFDHPRYFQMLSDDSRLGRALRRRRAQQVANAPEPTSVPEPASVPEPSTGTTRPTRIARAQRVARRAVTETGFRTVAFGRPWRAPRGFVDGWRAQWRDPERRRALREIVLRIREEYIDVDPFDLASITVPVLALWGSNDRLVLVSSRARMEAALPDLEFIELPGVGHMPQLEVPGRTTKHLHAFAQRVAPTHSPAAIDG